MFVGLGEDACLLPISFGDDPPQLGLPVGAQLHGDAGPLRFHPLEDALPVLLRQGEFTHTEIDHLDTVGGRNKSLNAGTYLRDYRPEPVLRSMRRDEGGEAMAAEHCTDFTDDSLRKPLLGIAARGKRREEARRFGDAPGGERGNGHVLPVRRDVLNGPSAQV